MSETLTKEDEIIREMVHILWNRMSTEQKVKFFNHDKSFIGQDANCVICKYRPELSKVWCELTDKEQDVVLQWFCEKMGF